MSTITDVITVYAISVHHIRHVVKGYREGKIKYPIKQKYRQVGYQCLIGYFTLTSIALPCDSGNNQISPFYNRGRFQMAEYHDTPTKEYQVGSYGQARCRPVIPFLVNGPKITNTHNIWSHSTHNRIFNIIPYQHKKYSFAAQYA